MKQKLNLLLLLISIAATSYAQTTYTGIFRSQSPYSNYHQFTRDGGGAAVYINQLNTSNAILRLSSGTASANGNVLFTVEGSGNVGIGTIAPLNILHVKGDPANDPNFGDRQILGYFEQSRPNSSGAGIAIKGAKNNSSSTVAYLDFDIYDSNESNTDFTLGRVGGGKEGDGINGQLRFYTNTGSGLTEHMRIKSNGDIGIGTKLPDAKLAVNGTIHAKRVKVDLDFTAPDYVFEDDYELKSIEETARYIEENKHLPEVPAASVLEAEGFDVAEMNMLLLQKIEELTLYVIKQQKEIDELKAQSGKKN